MRYALVLLFLFAWMCTEASCNRNMRINLRTTQGSGVGFNQGYTSLDAFFSSSQCHFGSWLPYVDLRGHLFNNGWQATNAGVGIRHLNEISFGLNGYWDSRKTKHLYYHQLGAGIEILGSFWGIDLNGYLPIGEKKSGLFGETSFEGVVQSFSFVGHQLFLNGAFFSQAKEEIAFKGIDLNLNFGLVKKENLSFDFGIGPYYYKGYSESAAGAQAQLKARLSEYVSLSGKISWDHLFQLRGSGELGVHIPFGPRSLKRKSCLKQECDFSSFVGRKFSRGADRSEIMVLDQREKTLTAETILAIDPATSEPYNFIFVNNQSGSNGTFEDPYATLLDAQNASSQRDIIYVYPGDGTTTGMNAGITLKDFQKFWGAGTGHPLVTTVGTLTVPAQASSSPHITQAAGDGQVVKAANNNEIAGFYILVNTGSNPGGIICDSITNATITNNTIDTQTGSWGIYLTNTGGTISISQNSIFIDDPVQTFSTWAIQFESDSGGGNYLVSDNTFISHLADGTCVGSGFEIGNSGVAAFQNFALFSAQNNQFVNLGVTATEGKPIGGYGIGGTGNVLIDSNTFTTCSSGAPKAHPAQIFLTIRSGDIVSKITNNTWTNPTVAASVSALRVQTDSGASFCLTLDGNTSDSTVAAGAYALEVGASSTFTADIGTNTGTVVDTGVTPGTCPSID